MGGCIGERALPTGRTVSKAGYQPLTKRIQDGFGGERPGQRLEKVVLGGPADRLLALTDTEFRIHDGGYRLGLGV